MTRQPPDPRSPADDQRTRALPRRGADQGREPDFDGDGRGESQGHGGARRTSATGAGQTSYPPQYQETTVLRRPGAATASPAHTASNVPGAGRTDTRPRAEDSAGRRRPTRDGAHLPPYSEPELPPARGRRNEDTDGGTDSGRDRHGAGEDNGAPTGRPSGAPPRGLRRQPRKLTVTRVAALRSRELTHRGLEKFHGAVSADGAGQSGLGHLTYAVMANYAVDAALAVALANTLFFAAAKADSTGKVLLYLLLTVAPFAVIAPFIGPLLDRLQRGRRFALAASSVGRAVLAVTMALKFDSWVIYPCALGMLVLSKGFGVLKAALTPRVLPRAITLVKTNSRLTVFGLIAGGVSGGIAAGIAALTTSAGALWFTAACALVGAWLCLRIPAWVESTEGEVPIQHTGAIRRPGTAAKAHGLPRPVAVTLWANSVIRVETGFLALFIAFVIKTRYQAAPVSTVPGVAIGATTDNQGWMQLLLLGAIGAAAGLGGFIGNGLGARLPLRSPPTVAFWCLGGVILAVIGAFIFPGLISAGIVALVGSTASSLAKVCLDATIQQGLPEVSRASAFGRSESILQLSWVFGGVIGLLIGGVWVLGGNAVYLVGFGIVGLILIAGAAQCVAVRLGRSLIPPIHLRRRRRGASETVAKWPVTNQPGEYPPRPNGAPGRPERGKHPGGQTTSTQPLAADGGRRKVRKAGRPR